MSTAHIQTFANSSLPSDAEASIPADRRRELVERLTPYAFLLPYILLFLTFSLFPLLFSIYLSFQTWNPLEGLGAMKYTGLENYQIALTDPWLWKALRNTVWIGIVSGAAQHLIAIPMACILAGLGSRVRHILSSAYFLPYITSTVAVSLIFFVIYSPEFGILNRVLTALSDFPLTSWLFGWIKDVMPIQWLSGSKMIKPAIAIVVTWKYTGFNMVLYTTGLMSIPGELYEAATIDGANAWQRFRHITLPMLRPFIFFAVTLTLIGNLQLFEEPFILTRGLGGTGQSGLTLSHFLYKVGWQWLEMGTASAVSWIMFFIIGVFTALHFFFFGRKGLGGN